MATVTNQTTFMAALTARDPEIILANDITLSAYASITYAVTIKGATTETVLYWGNPTPTSTDMLVVSETGVLTLESIILDADNRNGTLVKVNGGTLIMNEGTIVRNIYSRTANNGIYVGMSAGGVGGTFIMNSGLVTGINSADAVLCQGGSVVMNNDAAVSGNNAAGVTVLVAEDRSRRGSFTMTGNARISGNRSMQAGAGVVIYESDMHMGVNEGDAPLITDNRPPAGHFGGGIVMSDDSTLTMGRDAKITGNFTDLAGGGILAQDTVIVMRHNAAIEDNVCADVIGGGGLRLLANATLTMEDNARISGNTSVGYGGGVFLQAGATLVMKDNASLQENEALTGGGLFITALGKADLSGHALINNNEAEKGKGVYKLGALTVSQSAQLQDGLYFDDPSVTGAAASLSQKNVELRIVAAPAGDGSHIVLSAAQKPDKAAAVRSTALQQEPAYTANVPVVADHLTEQAKIVLEASPYVAVSNVSLVIADKHPDCDPLLENDRAPWVLPPDFGPEHEVILNEACDQVLVDYKVYHIYYCHLYGAYNPNPATYSAASDFPIILQAPCERKGYVFTGWYDCEGRRVTKIRAGTIGDLRLIALWEKREPLFVCFDGNAPCVTQVPGPIHAEPYSCVTIPPTRPKKPNYCFKGWNTCPNGLGAMYAPCDCIRIREHSITLYAQWKSVYCQDPIYYAKR